MGWSSGVNIFINVAESLEKNFPGVMSHLHKRSKQNVLESLIGVLEDGDCDTLDDAWGTSPDGDKALEAAGYHNIGPNCVENDDYSCSCGWEEK